MARPRLLRPRDRELSRTPARVERDREDIVARRVVAGECPGGLTGQCHGLPRACASDRAIQAPLGETEVAQLQDLLARIIEGGPSQPVARPIAQPTNPQASP